MGDGGLRGRTLYFSTVDLATSMSSLRSSLRMRRDPQKGLARDTLRIRSRISWAMAGQPRVPGSAQSSPVVAKSLALPGDHRARLDEDEGVLPTRPRLREPDPEQAVGRLEPWAPPTAVKHCELMPQGEDLEVQGDAGAEHGDQGNHQCDEDSSHGEHSSRAVAAAQRRRRGPSYPCRRLAGPPHG